MQAPKPTSRIHKVNKRGNATSYFRTLLTVAKSHRQQIALQLGITILLSAMSAIGIPLTQWSIDAITSALMGQGIILAGLLIAAQVGLEFIATFIGELNRISLTTMNHSVRLELLTPIIRKAQRVPLIDLECTAYHELLRKAQGVASRGILTFDTILNAGQSLISAFAFLAFLVNFHWVLGLLLPVFAVPNFIWGASLAQGITAGTRGLTPIGRLMLYLEDLLLGRQSAKEVRVYNLTEFLLGKYQDSYWKDAREKTKLVRHQALSTFKSKGLYALIFLASSLIILFVITDRNGTVGTYVALIQATIGLHASITSLSQEFSQLYTNMLLMEDYFCFLEIPEEVSGRTHFNNSFYPLTKIDVKDVTFRYPGKQDPCLHDISFTAKRGEIVAIVGENGSGKTTLVKCLMGLYPVERGTVSFNGVDITQIPKQALYTRISFLFQDFGQYQLTARENIAFGDLSKLNDDNSLLHSARMAHADSILDRLPEGLDTSLGFISGPGGEISYGEWQRLALGRAFLKASDVIVLDEPTAAVDPTTELNLFRQVKTAASGEKLVIVVSHRLGICREADRIIVLRDGRIEEAGNHEELVSAGGVYTRMYTAQASLYAPDSHNSY